MQLRETTLPFLGLVATACLVAIGTLWAFERGGNDFLVFHEAWKLVLAGKGAFIYRQGPDRFLYAPVYAWILSPLGILPRAAALALWCFAKAAVIGLIIREFGIRLQTQYVGSEGNRLIGVGISGWAVLVIARPLLIDFQYGQVNTLVLGACIWALLSHFDETQASWKVAAAWIALSIAAFSKLFPLPLLFVPWVVTRNVSRRNLRLERMAIALGFAATFLIPVLSLGWRGAWDLLLDWRQALVARGLPMESHNQSFAAFLHHYLSGSPTPVIAEGTEPLTLGYGWFSGELIVLLSLAWTFTGIGIELGWIFHGASQYSQPQSSPRPPLGWIVIAIGLLIVPGHLVWKPYFVMGLPLAVLAVNQCRFEVAPRRRILQVFFLVAIFLGINFTGFDFVGHFFGARLEAASLFLFLHLMLLLTPRLFERRAVCSNPSSFYPLAPSDPIGTSAPPDYDLQRSWKIHEYRRFEKQNKDS